MTPPIREMTARDRGFVAATWMRAARYGFAVSREERLAFRIVNALLERAPRVLCIATDERTVHAWAAGQESTLHFVYVAPELRRQGLARLLLRDMFGEAGPSLCSHEMPRKLCPRAHFNPYIVAGALCGESRREAA